MINRHYLRAKILQTLYGYFLSGSQDIERAERRLFTEINNLYPLEVYFFSIILELRDMEENLLQESKDKFYPTKRDLNPNMRFVNNAFIAQLAANTELKQAIKKFKVNWHDSDLLFKNIMADIKQTERYHEYMEAEETNYNADKRFICKVFEEHIMGNRQLQEVFYEKHTEWESDYWYVVDIFLAFLRKFKEEDDETKPLLRPFVKDEEELQSDKEFVECLFRNTIAMYDKYETMIETRLEHWDLNRLAFIDTLLLKMGMAELVFSPTIPIRVTLNEYIELAKEFSTDRSSVFVNGMLDRLIIDLRSQGLIQKEGRGLKDKNEGSEWMGTLKINMEI
jgi:N utilization substance protein B